MQFMRPEPKNQPLDLGHPLTPHLSPELRKREMTVRGSGDATKLYRAHAMAAWGFLVGSILSS